MSAAAERQSPPAQVPASERRPRRWPRAVLLVTLLLAVALVGYGATLAPVHYAQLQERASDGAEASHLGGSATVVAPEGWGVRPRVGELISWPPLPPLLDWSVVFGTETGVVLTSPDGVLTVELARTSAKTAVGAAAAFGADREFASGALNGQHARSERLASGADLEHFDGKRVIFGTLRFDGDGDGGATAVAVLARTRGHDISAYRPALSELLERVTAGG